MEVHHHAHSSRKKWTHYLWEFLMLFLAVFCGFLAENQREHYVEHLREKVFIRSVVKDIEIDSATIGYVINHNEQVIAGLDSLVNIMDTVMAPQDHELVKIYDLFYKWGSSPGFVSFNDRTISQLKSGGGMRLIRKQASSDVIANYYNAVAFCSEQMKIYNTTMMRVNEISYKFMDVLHKNKDHENMLLAKKLFNDNAGTAREFINWTADLIGVIKSYNELLFQTRDFGTSLIQTLKKDYHLK